MGAGRKFEVIQKTLRDEDNMLNVSMLCEIAGVSRSGYYRWVKAADVRAEKERKESKPIQAYGKGTENQQCRGELLGRRFTEYSSRKVLLTDITYIPYNGTFAYLSTVLDAYTKQILSYVMSDSLEVEFVLATVRKVTKDHGIELSKETLIHSDQGCHDTSTSFIQIVNDKELRQSMSRRGDCWDNAPQESFFGHMKDEIDVSGCIKFREVKAMVDDWMDYYNRERYQWQLAKLSPDEYYEYITTGIYPLKGVVDERESERTFPIDNF